MIKNKEYFKKQIKGLIMILEEGEQKKFGMVARNYVIKKLKMVLEYGINFHPSIEEKLEK